MDTQNDNSNLLDNSLKYAAEKLKIPNFREHQENAIRKCLNGHDVFVSLPTSYGKSKIFQGVPLCKKFMKESCNAEGNPIALVVSPIVAIIQQQVAELNTKDIPALHLRVDENWAKTRSSIASGKYSLIYGSPETFAKSATRDLLASMEVRSNICGLFIDESHCIEQWGYSSTNTTAFRETFSKLADLRALIPSRIPVMSLTATATSEVREKIITSLEMHSPTLISLSPDRPNIKYSKVNIDCIKPHESTEAFDWLVKKLIDEQEKMDKIIIYCRNRKQCTSLYGIFVKAAPNNNNFDMCHGGTDSEVSNDIVKDFESPDGVIRLLFATVAFGMGVDAKGVHLIMHLGIPNTIGDYIQESGRAGRDGQQSVSIILTYPEMYKDSTVNSKMKDYINNLKSECRRKLLLNEFDNEQPKFDRAAHFCCDICDKTCNCVDSCANACYIETEVRENFGRISLESTRSFPRREVSESDIHLLETILLDHRSSLMDETSERYLAGGDITTGLPLEYVNKIVKECNIAYPYEVFTERCPMYDENLSKTVWSLMTNILAKCNIISDAQESSNSDDNEELAESDDENQQNDLDQVDTDQEFSDESSYSDNGDEANLELTELQSYQFSYSLLYSDDD